jgi:DNA polymerase (family 10)
VSKNIEIADILDQIGDILEIKGELPFKVAAYRKASRVIADLQQDIAELWKTKQLGILPGIGQAMQKKIDEFLTTGHVSKHDELLREVPSTLLELMNIQNLGPKTIGLAHKKLGVNSLSDLQQVLEDGRLAQLPGMGEKKIENIRKGIEHFQTAAERISIGTALPLIERIIAEIRERIPASQISAAGSSRRMRETVGDIDILVAADNGKAVIDTFTQLPFVTRILAAGETKGSVLIENKIQVDLRAVSPDSYGAALQYFTGSQAHNIKLRGIARKLNYKINEYGIFKGEQKRGGAKEAEIYNLLKLPWIPPELREDRGEIEAASRNELPDLIRLEDIQGDLHVHSNYSDGHFSIAEMAQAAQKRGYRYLAFCDHSQSAFYANGLNPDRLLGQIEEIRKLNENLAAFQILAGTEVDILPNGELDFPDEILQQLDIVVASIHSAFKQHPTERIISAMENPYVDIIGHPTGRLISRREGYEIDLDKIIKTAVRTGTALEINAYPDRLDLSDVNARRAIDAGVMLAINTDAHSIDDLSAMKFGIATARRGWVGKDNVLNTLGPAQIKRRSSVNSV